MHEPIRQTIVKTNSKAIIIIILTYSERGMFESYLQFFFRVIRGFRKGTEFISTCRGSTVYNVITYGCLARVWGEHLKK